MFVEVLGLTYHSPITIPPLLSGPLPLSAFTSASALFTPVAGALTFRRWCSPVLRRFRRCVCTACSARSSVGHSPNAAVFLPASRRLCCSGRCAKASAHRLSNRPPLAEAASDRQALSKRRPLSTATCDSVHLRPF